MANDINRGNRGLLGVLRAKVGGQTPRTFSEEVRFGMDLLPFIVNENLERISQTSSSSAASGQVTIYTVPSNEVWYLVSGMLATHMTVANATNGGTSVAECVLASFPLVTTGATGEVNLAQVSMKWAAGEATQDSMAFAVLQTPFLLPPLSTLAIRNLDNQSGDTIVYDLQALVARFPV